MLNGMSLDEMRRKIEKKLNPTDPDARWTWWVRELYEDRVIISERDGDLYEVPYTVGADGEVELGERRKVEVQYVPASLLMAFAAAGIPSEIQVIPYGETSTGKGDFTLDEDAMKAVIADFEKRKTDMVIDYEHQTLTGREAPAAGWIKKLVNKGKDGLWAVVEWTEKAKEYLKNREYRYLSPVFLKKISDGKVLRLLNAALTNTPAIDGMVPLVNKWDFHQPEKEAKSMKKLLELLGLKAEATEDEAVAAVQAMKDENAALKEKGSELVAAKEVIEALGLKEGAELSEVTGTIMALKAGHEQSGDLAKEVNGLKTKLRKREAEEAVSAAMKEGKVTPAQKEYFLSMAEKDPAQFQAYVKIAAKQVITDEIAGGKEATGGDAGAKLDALTRAKLQANKDLTYSQAFGEVQSENPELAAAYAEALKGQ
jgi:phage I-like protein